MTYNGEKLGAFIVPTGVGASIGGYAGDASSYARKFAQKSKLIVNPNVVNAGCFSGITDNMLYVEGYSLDSFFKGEINLIPSKDNKIGIVYDKAIPNDVLNVHINTQNAVKTVYGMDICEFEETEEEVGVEFFVNDEGISVGNVRNITTLEKSCKNDISKKFKIPCAHSPAFADYQIYPELVDPKSASEYITPTFLPCILLGLSNAPKITTDLTKGINIKNLDYLVMPYNCLGSTPVFEALKHGVKVYAVKENQTELNVTKEKLLPDGDIIEVENYENLFCLI